MELRRFAIKDFNLLIKSAKLYDKNLKDNDFLIVFKDENKINYVEVKCRKMNFMHLTGVKYINRNLRDRIKPNGDYQETYANHFYDLIMSNRLDIEHCYYKIDGTTSIKLEILSQVFNFPYNAAMIGNYNNVKPHLYTKKLCGGVACCMGFVNANASFYPNTTLKEDIRKLTERVCPIVMICKKNKNKAKYEEVTRKGKLLKSVKLPKEILEMLSEECIIK